MRSLLNHAKYMMSIGLRYRKVPNKKSLKIPKKEVLSIRKSEQLSG